MFPLDQIADVGVNVSMIVCVYLHSNFSGGLGKTIFLRTSAFQPFKVIQGH